MDLSNLIADKAKAADYIIEDITYIIKNFEKRGPGSKGEQQACEYMADRLREYGCDRVEVEEFEENPGSFFGWIWITFTLMFIGLITYFFAPIVSVILIVLGWAICILQFGMYKKFVDKLFPKATGHNVTAFKAPTGEVKRRIVFNGHPDGAWEWPLNYHFNGIVHDALIICAAVGALFYLVLSLVSLFITGPIGSPDGILKTLGLVGLVFTPFWIGMYRMWDRKLIVDGANDNLSGCYMGIALMKALKENAIEFENTEIGVVLTGSEEAGLRGAKAWSARHAHEFNDVPTFFYSYDTIHDPKYLMVNYRDLNGTVKADTDVSDLFMEAANELGIQCSKGMVPPFGGATDNAAFTQAGLRSTGITGLNHVIEDYYHTRRDTYDNMNAQGLADCYAVTVKVLEKFDNGAKQ